VLESSLESSRTDEGAARRVGAERLLPVVRPAHHDRVGAQAAHAGGLDERADALAQVLAEDDLGEAAHLGQLERRLQALLSSRFHLLAVIATN